MQPHVPALERRFLDKLRRLGYESRQRKALAAITPGAAAAVLAARGLPPEFVEQVQYNGRRLAKLKLEPVRIVSALQEYDRLLAPIVGALDASGRGSLRQALEQWYFCVVLTLNNAFYQVGETEALYGEAVVVYEERGDWRWGQLARDGYVGYVFRAALSAGVVEPTHWVSVLRTYAFSKPDLKSGPLGLFTLNSLVRIKESEGRFGRAEGTGWFTLSQRAKVDSQLSDRVEEQWTKVQLANEALRMSTLEDSVPPSAVASAQAGFEETGEGLAAFRDSRFQRFHEFL